MATALCAAALPLLLASCAEKELLKRQATLNAQIKREKALRHPEEVARLEKELAELHKEMSEQRYQNTTASLGFLMEHNEMMEQRRQDHAAHLAAQGSSHISNTAVSAAASSATHNAAPIVGHGH